MRPGRIILLLAITPPRHKCDIPQCASIWVFLASVLDARLALVMPENGVVASKGRVTEPGYA